MEILDLDDVMSGSANIGTSYGDPEPGERCQEVKAGGEEETTILGIGANSKSHLVRHRVPGIRVKGDDETRFVVIPGRKGKKGEKVVVLGADQKWMANDPPITVYSDEESDTLGERKGLKNTTHEGVCDGMSIPISSDSEDGIGWINKTLEEEAGCTSGQEKGHRRERIWSTVYHDNTGFSASREKERHESLYGEVERGFKMKQKDSQRETVSRKDFKKHPQQDFTPHMENFFEGGRTTSLEGKKPMKTGSAFVIRTEIDSENEFVNGKRCRCNSPDDFIRKKIPVQRKPYSDFNRPDRNVDLSDTSQSFHKPQKAEPAGGLDFSSLSPRTKVNKLRQMFHESRRILSDEEDMRLRRVGTVSGAGRLRADLKAYSYVEKQVMLRKGSENPSVMGSIPGTEVGDYFFYRIELLLVGLHRQVQAGIDFITASKTKYYDTRGNALSVAVSVVSVRGGGYQNKHEGETLVYTGQGSNKSDQDLVRGNLALKNSCDLGLSVRVVRGIDVMKGDAAISFGECPVLQSPSGSIYFYDGLYDVKNYFQDVGPGGFKVWKFKLVRQRGQRPIPHIFMTAV